MTIINDGNDIINCKGAYSFRHMEMTANIESKECRSNRLRNPVLDQEVIHAATSDDNERSAIGTWAQTLHLEISSSDCRKLESI